MHILYVDCSRVRSGPHTEKSGEEGHLDFVVPQNKEVCAEFPPDTVPRDTHTVPVV